MAASASAAAISAPFGSQFKTGDVKLRKMGALGNPGRAALPSSLYQGKQRLTVCAEHNNGSRGGGGDFLAGFIVGGALFGTLAYVFAPQIRRSILNEDEYGFRRAKRPIYYDEGLEKTRQTLNAKISQLNSAIDNVSSRLRGGNNVLKEQMETDPEVEAAL